MSGDKEPAAASRRPIEPAFSERPSSRAAARVRPLHVPRLHPLPSERIAPSRCDPRPGVTESGCCGGQYGQPDSASTAIGTSVLSAKYRLACRRPSVFRARSQNYRFAWMSPWVRELRPRGVDAAIRPNSVDGRIHSFGQIVSLPPAAGPQEKVPAEYGCHVSRGGPSTGGRSVEGSFFSLRSGRGRTVHRGCE